MCWADPFFPDYSLPDHILDATVKSLETNGAHYTLPIGDKELREEIAKRVKRVNGLNIDPGKNITVCCGSDAAFIFSMRPFLVPGEFNEVLIPTPSYANNFGIPPLAGGVTVTVPTFAEDEYDLRIEEFEKRLEGGLYHFKCPTCKGIFAIKKSKGNNKKPTKMTCPDCGAIGVISSSPCQIEEVIPEKKSVKANFKCNICGEGITIWAEGTDLYKNVNVYSCPFCGEKKPLTRF